MKGTNGARLETRKVGTKVWLLPPFGVRHGGTSRGYRDSHLVGLVILHLLLHFLQARLELVL